MDGNQHHSEPYRGSCSSFVFLLDHIKAPKKDSYLEAHGDVAHAEVVVGLLAQRGEGDVDVVDVHGKVEDGPED